ncbi:MAG: hypothetical protein EU521_00850 [Promethearchaeota archaeon]|nr:MAG: hypothetical protein EU521_00850 [Candidatus Lokiarchaeota archaeon]
MDLFTSREDKRWIDRCKEILLNRENYNPFPKPPIATNFYNNPPSFCYGRDRQIAEIQGEIDESLKSKPPKLIRVIGKQGIGKSTLICWATKKKSEVYPIPIVYLETSGQPEDLEMKSLYRQIISKIEKSDFKTILLLNSIKRFINLLTDKGGNVYRELNQKFSGEDIDKLSTDINYVKEKIKDLSFFNKLNELVKNNIIFLQRVINIDLNFLLIFWKAHIQNPEAMDSLKAFKGSFSYSGYSIETDNDASKYIDELIELIRWSFNKKSTIVLIFDHLEAGTSEHQENVYKNLFSLLLNLRQKKFLTIIISGTLDAFDALDQVLQEDQRLQLNNWSKVIGLSSLDSEYVLDIIHKYLSDFWSPFNYQPPSNKSLFPFGESSVKYLYENNNFDLRKTLRDLYELIEKYKRKGDLELIENFFQAFKAFRKRDDVKLSYTEQIEFVNLLLDSNIQDKNRSTMAEMAIYDFFNLLKDHPDYIYLTDVKHEPPLGRTGKKPDVFLEFFANEGAEFVKNLGIEVKIYRKSNKISKADIKKTYQLLEENALDYVTWISNVELDLQYRFSIDEDLKIHLGRVSPLNDLELGYLSFMVFFKKIYGREPKLNEVELLLKKIGLSPIDLKERIKHLTKLTETIEPGRVIDITNYGVTRDFESPKKEKELEGFISEEPKVEPIEIGREQIKRAVKNYIEEKSRTNKQITYHYTTQAVRDELNIEEDKEVDDDIWAIALDIGKDYCVKQTPKTIYFNP